MTRLHVGNNITTMKNNEELRFKIVRNNLNP